MALVAEVTQRRCHLVLVVPVAPVAQVALAAVAASVADTGASMVVVGEEASEEDSVVVVVVFVEATEEVTETLVLLVGTEMGMALQGMLLQDLAVTTGETVTATATADMEVEADAATTEIAIVIVIVTATVAAMVTAMAAGREATWSQLAVERVGTATRETETETSTDPGMMTTESVVLREGVTKTLVNCVVTRLSIGSLASL